MSQDDAHRLGLYIRARREELGLSARRVARAVDVQDSTIHRLEAGVYAKPSASKLARLAEYLDLDLADLFAMADYAVPDSLPSLPEYLRLRYPALTSGAIESLNDHLLEEAGQSASHFETSAGDK
jgi:transcriptional regulator with XRE-family HTH domain